MERTTKRDALIAARSLMTYLPIYLELTARRCLVVGGGEVASRRVASLVAHGADVTIVAPEVVVALGKLSRQNVVEWNPCAYEARFMDGMSLVVAATSDPLVNEKIAQDARAKSVLVCRADVSGEGDFIFPGVLERGELTLSVATLGGSPTLTSVLLERLAGEYGPEWSEIVKLCKTVREDIKVSGKTAEGRKAGVRRILADEEIRTLLNDGKFTEAEARARECLFLS